METLTNPNPIEEIVKLLPIAKDKIEETTNEMKNYLEYLKVEKFEERENEHEENEIKRAESIYDRLDEILQRRRLVVQNGKETIKLINEVKLKIKSVVESCEKDELYLAKANDELIGKIIDLEDRKRIRDIKPLQQQIDNINNESNKKIQDFIRNLKNPEEYYRKKEEEDTKRKKEDEEKKRKEDELRKQEEEKKKKERKKDEILNNEMNRIEEWTSMKIVNIIFDSEVDNWNVKRSEFDERVLNRSNLIFIIEDDDDNKFGGYINSKIDKCDEWITDSESFVFFIKVKWKIKWNVEI